MENGKIFWIWHSKQITIFLLGWTDLMEIWRISMESNRWPPQPDNLNFPLASLSMFVHRKNKIPTLSKIEMEKKELFKHINPNNKNWDEKTEMKMENKKKFIWKEIFPRPHYKTEIFLENYRNVADFPFTILQRSNNRFFLLLLCLFREKIS